MGGAQGIVWLLQINRGQMHTGAGQMLDSWVSWSLFGHGMAKTIPWKM